MNRKDSGFTLIELMIVIAIIAIIASIAIPNLLSSRLASNEAAAIATLRNLHSAQDQFQAMGVTDQDTIGANLWPDGRGEFGYFRELCGAVMPRSSSPNPPAAINPAVYPQVFALLEAGGGGFGGVNRSGYFFQMWLPDTAGAPVGEPLADPGIAGTYGAVPADANNQEAQWVCYAIPTVIDTSGTRAFVIDASGEVRQTLNDTNAPLRYGVDIAAFPTGDAGFTVAGSIVSAGGNSLADNALGVDGNFWTSAGN